MSEGRRFIVAVALILAAAVAVATNGAPKPHEPPPPTEAISGGRAPSPSPHRPNRRPRHRVRRDLEAARRTATRFLRQLLAYQYGYGEPRLLDATRTLRDQLTSSPPPTPRSDARPELIALATEQLSHNRAVLTAIVDDGRRRYELHLAVVRRDQRWRAATLG